MISAAFRYGFVMEIHNLHYNSEREGTIQYSSLLLPAFLKLSQTTVSNTYDDVVFLQKESTAF